MALALSHGGPAIYRSPSRSRQVLVGTIRGVVRMERDTGGTGWRIADRTLDDKHIHALLIEPESGTVFAGVNHGSIFASTWSFFTSSLKSTEMSIIGPETNEPTWTERIGFTVPVELTTATMRPRVTSASR